MDTHFALNVALAFLGGAILNVMPCVLPVLTMKVFHLMEQADQDPGSHRLHGIAYGIGVVGTFVGFAALVLFLRASGDMVGWGMHFANPVFVATMTAVVFVFGLNALGVFEFSVALHEGAPRQGYVGSAVNGVVASIMSTPCSAPFLGTAAGFALASGAPWWQTLVIFIVIGCGLASPFVVLSFVPALGRLLPRPGAWMETFKHLMGFTLMAATVWLFSVLQQQTASSSSSYFLAFLLIVAMAAWAVGRFGGPIHGALRRYGVRVAAIAAVVLGGVSFIDLQPPSVSAVTVTADEPVVVDDRINWVPFDSNVVLATLDAGRPVFMDYTADWCANCKANERLFIEVPEVRNALVQTQILPVKADLTVENVEIQRWMEPFPVAGIPVYVIYFPDRTYDLLPQTITTELLTTRLEAASERYPAEGFLK